MVEQVNSFDDQLTSEFEVVRTIHQENGGVILSEKYWNQSILREIILLFVDGDDFWNNLEFLNKLLSRTIKKYSSDVVIFSYDKYYGR